MTEFIARLRQSKLVQWAIAYLAAAWVLLQAIDLAVDSYDWPHGVMRIAFGLIALGFVVALVLAWYQGEKGWQRVSSAELLLIALVLAIGGGLLWRFGRPHHYRQRQRSPQLRISQRVARKQRSGIRERPSRIPSPARFHPGYGVRRLPRRRTVRRKPFRFQPNRLRCCRSST
jgi:adenylate cyclase